MRSLKMLLNHHLPVPLWRYLSLLRMTRHVWYVMIIIVPISSPFVLIISLWNYSDFFWYFFKVLKCGFHVIPQWSPKFRFICKCTITCFMDHIPTLWVMLYVQYNNYMNYIFNSLLTKILTKLITHLHLPHRGVEGDHPQNPRNPYHRHNQTGQR